MALDVLERMAMSWLRYEKRCELVMTERSPRALHGRPDVLGITQSRYLLEIEIKRSVSDFRANDNKPHIAARNGVVHPYREYPKEMLPKQFWYLVPHDLVEKVKPLLPIWAGLLKGPGPDDMQAVCCVIRAPTNKVSKRLSTEECVRLVHCMMNQMHHQLQVINHLKEKIVWDKTWNHPEQDYVI